MQNHNDGRTYYQQLRRLAVEDPRRAQDKFLEILHTDPGSLEVLLGLVSAPGEGRLRQLIAGAVRSLPEKERVVPFLIRWRDTETDEFAFRAINAALANLDLTSYIRPKSSTPLVQPEIVEGYRYASGRLSHKLRNALLNPQARLIRLRTASNALTDEQARAGLLSILGELNDDLLKIARILESIKADPEHFQIRPIHIAEWLGSMNRRYGRQFSPVKVTIQSDLKLESLIVLGSDHLLETIFWNLWVNAQQAVGEDCAVVIQIEEEAGHLKIVVIDNGDGFSPDLHDIAFQQPYSSKGSERGRGLLEVQDAVGQLHGQVGLVRFNPDEYRVRLILPIERS